MIDKLSFYVSNSSSLIFDTLVKEIYNFTMILENDYSDYQEWFYNAQIKGVLLKKREIFFVRDITSNKIIGISCVKNDDFEKKICTLFVDKNYRNTGIGTKLLLSSFEYLKTTTPLITFSYNKINMFKKFIKKYNWILTGVVEKDNFNYELIFNGNINNNCGKLFNDIYIEIYNC